MLLSHSALPCEGHMDAALHIMAYLGLHHNSHLCIDLTYPNIDNDQFPVMDWKKFYGNVQKPIPPNAPRPLGKPVDICMSIDSDHVGTYRPNVPLAAFQAMSTQPLLTGIQSIKLQSRQEFLE